MKNKIIILLLLISSTAIYSQNNELFDRLRAINTNGSLIFYNIDGIAITSETMIYGYKDINLEMAYDLYNVSTAKKEANSRLSYENVSTKIESKRNDKITEHSSYYFIKNKNNKVVIFHFGSINKTDEDFEIKFINLVMNDEIPESCFSKRPIETINIASRLIEIEGDCKYANVNSVQCPYSGQVSWSLHKELSDAKKQIGYEFEITKSKDEAKLTKEENINLVFEGVNTLAKKATFQVQSSSNPSLKSLEERKLITYYIAETVRGQNISCVLSHWDDDTLTAEGLPYLLTKLIKI